MKETYHCDSCLWSGDHAQTLKLTDHRSNIEHTYCPDCRSEIFPAPTELERKAIEPGIRWIEEARG